MKRPGEVANYWVEKTMTARMLIGTFFIWEYRVETTLCHMLVASATGGEAIADAIRVAARCNQLPAYERRG